MMRTINSDEDGTVEDKDEVEGELDETVSDVVTDLEEPDSDEDPSRAGAEQTERDEDPSKAETDRDDSEETQNEQDDHLNELLRVTSEFANFRKMTVKRHEEVVAQAAAKLVESLLPVLDAFEAAVAQGVDGIDALQSQMLGVLQGEGLSIVGVEGESFDPICHEAVVHETPEEEAGTGLQVTAVLRTGYAWQSRILRPAMVKVKG